MKYKKIQEYIPYLEKLENTDDGYNFISKESTPLLTFDREIITLREDLYNEGVIHQDYNKILKDYYGDRNVKTLKDEDVKKAPTIVVEALISNIIKQDRFVEGLLISCLKNGSLLFLIKELKKREED